MLKFKSFPILVGAAALGTLALMAPSAHATIMGQLTVANANLATQGSGPYANFTITGQGAGPTFNDFQVTATGINNFVFGDGGIFALNLSAGAGAGTLCLSATCPFTSTFLTSGGSGNEDGFGNFNFTLNDGPGFSTPHPSLSFEFMTANSVTEANLLTGLPNAAGHMALGTNTACTGFAANGGTGGGTVDNTACVAIPAPVIGHGPLVLLAVGGLLFGAKLFGRSRNHRGTAIPYAVA
jgi:hypothetical protein